MKHSDAKIRGPKSRINAIELKISLGTIIGTIEQSDRLGCFPIGRWKKVLCFEKQRNRFDKQ
ncbi:hypothetical protein Anas_08127 [Armadillidium nasatum]|uniref:Uncharacterized protein n=1 Tax=Armadillidium nasatum TaxID=96803 RepID=A0A5N5SX32_9CRUS|nr:hypothetical protein Anas_08127 [Armadillidium nasatum]